MERREYSKFLSHVLYDMELRSNMMTDIYDTKYDLFTEYLCLFSHANCQIYYLFHDFSLDTELEFYLNLDMLTYLPFEKLGYEYLNKKLENESSNVVEFKYNKIMKILEKVKFNISNEIQVNIKYFLDNYYNDKVELNIIGLAIITLRLIHRYVTIMNFGTFVGGSMGIQKKISQILDQITKDVNNNNLKEININDYLPEFDYNNKLNDDMVKYIELCLKREEID